MVIFHKIAKMEEELCYIHKSLLSSVKSRKAVCEESRPLQAVSGGIGIQTQGRKTIRTYFSELLAFSLFALFFRKSKKLSVSL